MISTKAEMKSIQQNSMKKLSDAQRSYENIVRTIENDFKSASTLQKREWKKQLEKESEKIRSQFDSMSSANDRLLKDTTTAIQFKIRLAKEMNLITRIKLMDFFTNYCDAKLYHSFEPCSDLKIPTLADSFEDVLAKINNLEWDALQQYSPKGIFEQTNIEQEEL